MVERHAEGERLMPYMEISRKSFVAAGPIPQDALVKLTAAGVDVCGAEDVPIGVTETGAVTAGDHVGVRLLNTCGTVEVNAAGTIALGDKLSPAADGTVAAATDGIVVGMALAAATAGDGLEIMPTVPQHKAPAVAPGA